MRKSFVLMMVFIVLIFLSGQAAMANTEISYESPDQIYVQVEPSRMNMMSALRMVFPDEFFEMNYRHFHEVMSGERMRLLSFNPDENIPILFNYQYPLMEHQMKHFQKTYGDLAYMNYFQLEALKSLEQSLTLGKLEYLMMTADI